MRDRLREFRASTEQRLAGLIDPDELHETIRRLHEDGALSLRQSEDLRAALPDALDRSRYILRNLAAHLAIGAIFAFDAIPLPLGTICRVTWVAGNRLYETLRGTHERAGVHSLPVFLIAAIPLAGYGAYVLPLRRESEEAAYVLANHLSYARAGRNVDEMVSGKPRIVRWLARLVVPTLSETTRFDS